MKLKWKFLWLGITSIICVISLAINTYTNLNKHKITVDKFINLETSSQNYINLNILSAIIQSQISDLVYNNVTINSENTKITKNKINDLYLLTNKDLDPNLTNYFDNKLYIEIKNLYNSYSTFIRAGNDVINSLGTENISKEYNKFINISTELNLKSEIIAKKVSSFLYKKSSQEYNFVQQTIKKTYGTTITALILICLSSLFAIVNLIYPLNKILKTMSAIVNNDKSPQEIPFISRDDEVGDVARALEIFHSTSIEKSKLEEQTKLQAQKIQEEKRNAMLILANQFENTVKAIVDTVIFSVKKMDNTALQLEELSKHTQEQAKLLSETSVKANSNIQGVSKATSDFHSSSSEINKQVNNSLEYTKKVAEQADKANLMVKDLEDKSAAINGIVDIINGITSQIDLLALNATIEAARAGDMGKGFAVVASEVKALATQTSKATEEINFQISGIQASTNNAVLSIHEITEAVKTINQNSVTIVSAIGKQSSSSSFIAESLAQVANISNTLTSGVDNVTNASNHSGKASSQMVSSASELLKQSMLLQNEVDKFLSSLKFT